MCQKEKTKRIIIIIRAQCLLGKEAKKLIRIFYKILFAFWVESGYNLGSDEIKDVWVEMLGFFLCE